MAKLAEDEMIIGVSAADTSESAAAAVKAGGAKRPAAAGEGEPEALVLQLVDLLPDSAGEVVLFADDTLSIALLTDEPLSVSGIAETHVTASGVDVTGHRFYSFGCGITVYSPTDIRISPA